MQSARARASQKLYSCSQFRLVRSCVYGLAPLRLKFGADKIKNPDSFSAHAIPSDSSSFASLHGCSFCGNGRGGREPGVREVPDDPGGRQHGGDDRHAGLL